METKTSEKPAFRTPFRTRIEVDLGNVPPYVAVQTLEDGFISHFCSRHALQVIRQEAAGKSRFVSLEEIREKGLKVENPGQFYYDCFRVARISEAHGLFGSTADHMCRMCRRHT